MAERQTQDSQANNNNNNKNKRLAGTPGADRGAHGKLKFNMTATDSDTIHRHIANNTTRGVHSRDSFSVASWSIPCAKLPPFRLRKGFVVWRWEQPSDVVLHSRNGVQIPQRVDNQWLRDRHTGQRGRQGKNNCNTLCIRS